MAGTVVDATLELSMPKLPAIGAHFRQGVMDAIMKTYMASDDEKQKQVVRTADAVCRERLGVGLFDNGKTMGEKFQLLFKDAFGPNSTLPFDENSQRRLAFLMAWVGTFDLFVADAQDLIAKVQSDDGSSDVTIALVNSFLGACDTDTSGKAKTANYLLTNDKYSKKSNPALAIDIVPNKILRAAVAFYAVKPLSTSALFGGAASALSAASITPGARSANPAKPDADRGFGDEQALLLKLRDNVVVNSASGNSYKLPKLMEALLQGLITGLEKRYGEGGKMRVRAGRCPTGSHMIIKFNGVEVTGRLREAVEAALMMFGNIEGVTAECKDDNGGWNGVAIYTKP